MISLIMYPLWTNVVSPGNNVLHLIESTNVVSKQMLKCYYYINLLFYIYVLVFPTK